MSYATVSDLVKRYQRRNLDTLVYREESNGPDDSVAEDALADATAVIDSYISARYTLPLSVVPDTLALQCCVIAWYLLQDVQATDQATQRYKDAMKWLADVRDGKVPLGVDEAGGAPVTEDLAEVHSDAAVFSRQQRGFI